MSAFTIFLHLFEIIGRDPCRVDVHFVTMLYDSTPI